MRRGISAADELRVLLERARADQAAVATGIETGNYLAAARAAQRVARKLQTCANLRAAILTAAFQRDGSVTAPPPSRR